MTMISCAILVTDAQKAGVISVINDLTPEFTIGFNRKCCAIDPLATSTTPATHWYTNAASVDADIVNIWQDAIDEAESTDDLYGVVLFTVMNHDDFVAWANVNLASKDLQFVPAGEA